MCQKCRYLLYKYNVSNKQPHLYKEKNQGNFLLPVRQAGPKQGVREGFQGSSRPCWAALLLPAFDKLCQFSETGQKPEGSHDFIEVRKQFTMHRLE